jgi:thiol-disulfide isomerase/thioredoxin
MHRRLLVVIIFLSVLLSGTGASLKSRVDGGSTGKGIVKEVDLDGLKKLLLRDPKRSRPLLINFWATWCDACREEFPDLVSIQKDYQKRGLDVVFISLDDPMDIETIVPQFLREVRAEKLPHYLLNVPDPEPAIKAVDTDWKGALPATFLYDAQRTIVFKHTGRIKPAELRAAIDKLVM